MNKSFDYMKQSSKLIKDFSSKSLMSFSAVLKKCIFYISIFIIIWKYALIYTDFDLDLWARLAVGKIFFQLGHVLNHDIFSFTQTKPLWVDHEWGSGVIFYFLASHFGDAGLLLLKILCSFLILFFISKIIELHNSKPDSHLNLLWYIPVLLAIFNGISSTVRSQLFTFTFFALWIYVLERIRRGENRLLWIIPVTMLIWANVHGGFVAGLGLLLIYGFGELLNKKSCKKYFLILIPAILVTLINPYGIHYWEYLFNALTMQRTTIAEWMPTPMLGSFKIWIWFKLMVLISSFGLIVSLIKNKFDFNRVDKVKYILFFITLWLAVSHIKHQPLFGIAAGCLFYHDFLGMFKTDNKIFNRLALAKDTIIYGFIITIGSIIAFSTPFEITVPSAKYPVGSVAFIKENKLEGNILTPFHWGSYLAWNLYPHCLIAIDGRYEEVYPEEINNLTANFDYVVDKNWYDFVKKYHTDILLLDKNLDSYKLISQIPFWKKICEDKTSAVFVPVTKLKKSYTIPKISRYDINRNKFNSEINF